MRIAERLKVFLTALAILDDIGAIVIIAIFYSKNIATIALTTAFMTFILMLICQRFKIRMLSVYLGLGLILWFFLYQAGIRTSLAGVATAMVIPIHRDPKISLLHRLEHRLNPWVAFLILPLFAFINAGVSFQKVSWVFLTNPLTLGIVCGLFFGKQLGVYLFSRMAIYFKWASLPDNVNYFSLYGVAILCGVGFTMSLFIGLLAFPRELPALLNQVKMGVILGSFCSGLLGYAVLYWSSALQRKHVR